VAQHNDGNPFIAPTFGQRLGERGLDGILLLPVLIVLTFTLSGAVFRVGAFMVVAAYDIGGVAIWGQTNRENGCSEPGL
jgi:hypothetical protein